MSTLAIDPGAMSWPEALPVPEPWLPLVISTADHPTVSGGFFATLDDGAASTLDEQLLDESSAMSAALSSAMSAVTAELARYEQFEARWDGYDAVPLEPDVILRARRLAQSAADRLASSGRVPDLITTGPASDGSLDVEFRLGSRRLFFTLYPDNHDSEVMALEEGKPANVEPLGEDALERWLGWMAG